MSYRWLDRWLARSIGNRITAVGAGLTVVFVLAVGLASYLVTRAQAMQSVGAELHSHAVLVAERFAQATTAMANDVDGLARTTLVANALVDSSGRASYLEPFLKDHLLPVKLPFSLYLTDHGGTVIAASATGIRPRVGTGWVRERVAAGVPRGEVVRGEASQLVFAYPVIYPSTGLAEGLLVLEVPLQGLVDLATRDIRSHSTSFLQGRDVIARVGRALDDPEVVTRRVAIPLAAPLADAGITVRIAQPESEAFRVLHLLGFGYVGFGLAALLLAVVLVRAAMRRVLAPLRDLTEAVERSRAEAGRATRFPTRGNDEVAQLGAALQHMVDRLRSVQDSLEQRVVERTAALEFAESRLREIHDNMLDGLITIDGRGTIESFNRSAERIFGYRAEEVVGRNVNCLMPEPYRSEHDGYLEHYRRTGERKIIGIGREVTGQRRDGTQFPMELSVSELDFRGRQMFVGIVQDITERKRAQEEMQELAFIVQRTSNGVVITDAQGRIEWINEGFTRMSGYTLDELRGRSPGHVLQGPGTDPGVVAQMRAQLALGEGFAADVLNYHKSGAEYWVALDVQPIRDETGRAIKFVSLETDITERKRIEKMKSEFISVVSHELRTPLTAIRGALGLVAGGVLGAVPAEVADVLRMAQENSERLTRLINDLLDVQKLEAGKMSFEFVVWPLSDLIRDAVLANRPFAERLEVTIEMPDRLPDVPVRIDPGRFQQVMANLLSNACKFSPRGGHVSVGALWQKDGFVRVSIRDRGPGIPEEFRARIFQKFSQADVSLARAQDGTGLGLNITKAIVERMGGRIGYQSDVGEGTTFHFELPVVAPQ